jgi:uroporphyrinogen decarboxylase
MTSRERVLASLNFELPPGERLPRQMWTLPWADLAYPGETKKIQTMYPDDICMCSSFLPHPQNLWADSGSGRPPIV